MKGNAKEPKPDIIKDLLKRGGISIRCRNWLYIIRRWLFRKKLFCFAIRFFFNLIYFLLDKFLRGSLEPSKFRSATKEENPKRSDFRV